jgi:hypothetical protein
MFIAVLRVLVKDVKGGRVGVVTMVVGRKD